MKLEDANEILNKNKNKTLEPTKKLSTFNSKDLIDLLSISFVYVNSKNPLKIIETKNLIKNNKLLTNCNFSKNEKKRVIYIENSNTKGFIMSAKFKNSSSTFPIGKCHDNSIKAAIAINNQKSSYNPVVLTGIVDFKLPDTTPYLHSVIKINSEKYGNLIIDYNLELIMSEKLYYVFTNLNLLGTLDVNQINKLYEKINECEGASLNGLKITSALIAFEDTIKVLEEIALNKSRKRN